jgi:2-dehydro-3-deoxyphosphogluconate aldolase / (4S)-4-hydroxy-2-oxoglutarate aldolase
MGEKAINHITCAGIIAILRASSSQALIDAAMALKDGGITAIEVTMTTPGALQTIEKAS